MADDAAALEAHLDAAAALLGLRVAPQWRASVLAHLGVTVTAARLVDAFPLEDEMEPAPIFAPIAPGGAA
ncbi:DUF4089 domain-containing protein [Chenggangzhangella methanolivorans]|uniref:DUF4089 domain-containing protein n=1 Tax=Chenggangzhangella methanolivorans TaxID=1437009 RepID=A0A9E6RG07_9HYPH|nr:DUF4089 domain-containing protein [Chenggangzhangella methanolivorans]QZO00292.1 DUF4089 domain-containing protein [Chenggangzhangella methanolivorans]